MKVILYGVGNRFVEHLMIPEAAEWFEDNGVEVVGISDREKMGEIKFGRSIIAIEPIEKNKIKEYDYIVITPMAVDEIAKQLMEKGIQEDKIIRLEEFFNKVSTRYAEYKYKLSVVACVYNEASYIQEWIEYYLLVGIEHFYIYDNDSTDDLKAVLSEYIGEEIVTYIEWPRYGRQVMAYEDARKRFMHESKYMAFLDADEFLAVSNGMSLQEYLNTLLSTYNEEKISGNPYEPWACGVAVNWRCYGPSGYEKRPDGLVTEKYLYRNQDMHKNNFWLKNILNPRACVHITPHSAWFPLGLRRITEDKNVVAQGMQRWRGRCEYIRVNHYQTKSVEEFIKRKKNQHQFGYDVEHSESELRAVIDKDYCDSNVYDALLKEISAKISCAIAKRKG